MLYESPAISESGARDHPSAFTNQCVPRTMYYHVSMRAVSSPVSSSNKLFTRQRWKKIKK